MEAYTPFSVFYIFFQDRDFAIIILVIKEWNQRWSATIVTWVNCQRFKYNYDKLNLMAFSVMK